jgi:hypothetical protein
LGSLAGWFGSPGWHTSMLQEADEARGKRPRFAWLDSREPALS